MCSVLFYQQEIHTYSLLSSDIPSGSSRSWVSTGEDGRPRLITAPYVWSSSTHTADSCKGPKNNANKVKLPLLHSNLSQSNKHLPAPNAGIWKNALEPELTKQRE